MKRRNRWKGLLLPGAAVFLAAVLNWFVVLNAYVPSGSMEPAVPSGSMVLGYRLAYQTEEPRTGDVVFFHHPEIGKRRWLVKRIVAVPGQTFALRDGRVYLDGRLLEEEYVEEFSDDTYPETEVPDGCYVVLGDNRRASEDSRFWEDPFVRREDILARGVCVFFPKFYRLQRK